LRFRRTAPRRARFLDDSPLPRSIAERDADRLAPDHAERRVIP
jgi:hypothetical protein